MIKKVFYSIEKEIELNGETKKVLSPEAYYKVSFANGEAISLTETEKNKLQ